jgi:hypothetical protein
MSILPMNVHSRKSLVVSRPVPAVRSPSLSKSSSVSVAHGFACASCTELGNTVSPAARTVATANTAAIKTVLLFIEKEYESIRIFELRRIQLLFRGRYIESIKSRVSNISNGYIESAYILELNKH